MSDTAVMIWFLVTTVGFFTLMVVGMFAASHTYVKHAHDPYPGDDRHRHA